MRDFKNLTENGSKPFSSRLVKATVFTVAFLLFLLPAILLARKGAETVSAWQKNRNSDDAKKSALAGTGSLKKLAVDESDENLFSVAESLIPAAVQDGDRLMAKASDGTELNLSINPFLQQHVTDYLQSANPMYAVFVAIEPATGRVLALASHSAVDPRWKQTAAYQVYPMASLFKMVTAAAALERQKINPATVIEFRGRLVSETPGNWDPHRKGRNHSMDVTDAMGKSVNPVYGRIASDLLGSDAIKETCRRFGFNRKQLLPGVPAAPSPAPPTSGRHALRLQGCGLDHDLMVSPIHAAAITAAIANRGSMMAPRLVDRASRDGKELDLPGSRELERIIRPDVASDLTQMLLTTVTTGTSRKAFHTAKGRMLLKDMNIAAKTGSINGDNPKGHYSWFTAFAPADNPRIAIVALVINGERWKIKATHVGEQALSRFFRM